MFKIGDIVIFNDLGKCTYGEQFVGIYNNINDQFVVTGTYCDPNINGSYSYFKIGADSYLMKNNYFILSEKYYRDLKIKKLLECSK